MLNERIQPDVELITQLDVDSITFGPFSNPYMKEIMRKFGKRAFGRSSACAEFESFVKQIRNGDRSGTCLEIGTFYGITAVLLSQYFEKVLCVSVDLDGDNCPGHGGDGRSSSDLIAWLHESGQQLEADRSESATHRHPRVIDSGGELLADIVDAEIIERQDHYRRARG